MSTDVDLKNTMPEVEIVANGAPREVVSALVDEATQDAEQRMLESVISQDFDSSGVEPGLQPVAPRAPASHRERETPWNRPTPAAAPPQPAPAAAILPPMLGRSQQPRTLEDLYAKWPVGDGAHFLRVRRLQPPKYGGQSVQGDLEDVPFQLTMEQFVHRFGGERYEVLVMGPTVRKGGVNDGGIETKATLMVTCPGPPNLNSLPNAYGSAAEEEFSMMNPSRSGYAGRPYAPPGFAPVGSPQVEVKRMEIEEARAEREAAERRELIQRAERGSQMPDGVLRHMESNADKSIGFMVEQQAVHLRRISELETEGNTLRNELVTAKAEAARNMHIGETDKTRELDKRYLGEIQTLKDQHARDLQDRAKELAEAKERATSEGNAALARHREEVERLRIDHQKEMGRARDEFQKDMDRLRSDFESRANQLSREYTEKATGFANERSRFETDAAKERERLREEAGRREQALKDAHDLQMTNLKTNYEARISDLEKWTQRDLNAVKEQTSREVAALRAQYESQERFSKETSGFKIESTNTEIARLRDDTKRLERENSELRKEMNKPFATQIAEIKETAEMLGFSPPGEKDETPAASEGPKNWKEALAVGLQNLLTNAPAIVKEVSGSVQAARAQSQAQAAQVAQARQQQQFAPPMQQQRRRQPPSLMSGMSPMAPQGWQNPPPPPPGTAPHGIPAAYQGPPPAPSPMGIGPPPSVVMHSQIPGPAAAPVTGTETPFRTMVSPLNESPAVPPVAPAAWPAEPTQPLWRPPVDGAAQPAPPQAAPVQAPPPPARAQPGAAPMPPEAIINFVDQLDSAIKSQIVTPQQFAIGFVSAVGPPTAMQVIQQVAADQFIAQVNSHPQGQQTDIVTRRGQKFVRDVWEETAKVASDLLRASA